VPKPRPATDARSLCPDVVLLFVLSTLWGASYTFIRIGVATIPPLTLIASRTLIAGCILAAWIWMRGTRVPLDVTLWRRFLVQGLLNSVVPFTFIAWAEQSVQAGVATILNSATPVFTFGAACLMTTHAPISLRKLLGVIAGLAGVCIIVGPAVFDEFGKQALPQLAIVAATLCYSAAAIYGRAFHGLSPTLPAAGSLLVGAALLVPMSLIVDHPWTLHPALPSLAALLALSVFSTALAFVIYFRLIRTLGPVATSAQAYLRVPIGVAMGVVFLGESLAPAAWMGLICVVGGVAALTVHPRTIRGDVHPETADAAVPLPHSTDACRHARRRSRQA
jgi:drug/metabolite transporter (DMT)-like permease